MVAITNVLIVPLLARGISRSDELENVLKMRKDISDQNIKEIVLTGVNIGDYGKENLETKTRTYILELVQELDKVRRNRGESLSHLLKTKTIEFVKKAGLYRISYSVTI
jgi:threonylcarbamoyladenosine tRNA methylthiotransferase MtaB